MPKLKIKNNTDLPNPEYIYNGDSGMDLRAAEELCLFPQSWALVPTGISIELEPGYEAQVRPRSGLALSHGVWCNFGTVDSNYRGELKVILFNMNDDLYVIRRGDRIAQMVVIKVERPEVEIVKELGRSNRGENGFGSTGLQ